MARLCATGLVVVGLALLPGSSGARPEHLGHSLVLKAVADELPPQQPTGESLLSVATGMLQETSNKEIVGVAAFTEVSGVSVYAALIGVFLLLGAIGPPGYFGRAAGGLLVLTVVVGGVVAYYAYIMCINEASILCASSVHGRVHLSWNIVRLVIGQHILLFDFVLIPACFALGWFSIGGCFAVTTIDSGSIRQTLVRGLIGLMCALHFHLVAYAVHDTFGLGLDTKDNLQSKVLYLFDLAALVYGIWFGVSSAEKTDDCEED